MSKTLPGFSLNSFVSPFPSGDWYRNVTYEDAKNMIKEKMISSAENFVAIGYYLKHIDETGQYKEGGYANIWECARQEFGFSQSKASRCINICKKYSADGDSPYINERFKSFDISQLQEMLPIKDEHLIEQITPDMSTREIRNVRNTEDTKDDSDSKVLKGQIQLATIEGEYREFGPASSNDTDKNNESDEELLLQKQDAVFTEMNDAESNTKELENDSIPREDTAAVVSAKSVGNDSDLEEKQSNGGNMEEAVEVIEECIQDKQEGRGESGTNVKDSASCFCYDLERIKVSLPCIVGEIVYFYDGDCIQKGIVDQIMLGEKMKPHIRIYDAAGGVWFNFEVPDFGRIIFLTHEDAEMVQNNQI